MLYAFLFPYALFLPHCYRCFAACSLLTIAPGCIPCCVNYDTQPIVIPFPSCRMVLLLKCTKPLTFSCILSSQLITAGCDCSYLYRGYGSHKSMYFLTGKSEADVYGHPTTIVEALKRRTPWSSPLQALRAADLYRWRRAFSDRSPPGLVSTWGVGLVIVCPMSALVNRWYRHLCARASGRIYPIATPTACWNKSRSRTMNSAPIAPMSERMYSQFRMTSRVTSTWERTLKGDLPPVPNVTQPSSTTLGIC